MSNPDPSESLSEYVSERLSEHVSERLSENVSEHVSEHVSEDQRILRGDLYWIDADPARGSVPGRPHPHLVLQEDVFNHSRIESVIVCALTSRLSRAHEPGNILLSVGEGSLEKQSVIVVSQVSAVLKAHLGLYNGALSQQRVDQVLAGLRFQQAAFFNRSS